MSKNKVYEGFLQALFFSGSVSIPRFLLDHYSYLGMTDREMMMVIHIMTEISAKNDDIDQQIMKKMGITSLEFKNIIENLHAKGLISVKQKSKRKLIKNTPLYDFGGLIDQLFELWGINQFKEMEASENQEYQKWTANSTNPFLSKLIGVFEQELGRPLTGFECEHIEKWLLASYSEELIVEALRRGVSAGIRSFRYLDSILREWEKKGIQTRLEVEAEDQNFQARQGKKRERQPKPQKSSRNKYDDIYL